MEEIICLGNVVRDIARSFHFELQNDIVRHGRKEFDSKRYIFSTVKVILEMEVLSMRVAAPFFSMQNIIDPDANSANVFDPKMMLSTDARFEEPFPRRVELVMQFIRKRRQARTTMLQNPTKRTCPQWKWIPRHAPAVNLSGPLSL